jgi:hypothetical protein
MGNERLKRILAKQELARMRLIYAQLFVLSSGLVACGS